VTIANVPKDIALHEIAIPTSQGRLKFILALRFDGSMPHSKPNPSCERTGRARALDIGTEGLRRDASMLLPHRTNGSSRAVLSIAHAVSLHV